MSTTSGASSSALRMASSPSSASPTTSMPVLGLEHHDRARAGRARGRRQIITLIASLTVRSLGVDHCPSLAQPGARPRLASQSEDSPA